MNQAVAYAILCIRRMFVIPCESTLHGGWGFRFLQGNLELLSAVELRPCLVCALLFFKLGRTYISSHGGFFSQTCMCKLKLCGFEDLRSMSGLMAGSRKPQLFRC